MGNLSRIKTELRRLENGPSPGEKPGGAGTVRFIAPCPLGASEVLEKVKSVLRIVDEVTLTGWLSDEQWEARLPDWFTARCAPPVSQEEAERRLAWRKSLPPDEQARVARETEWSLDAWLYWLEPDRREWFWWDAKALDDVDHIMVAVEVDGCPFPWDALRWLFRAAGASELNAEE
jgi:hypothetical protein